MSLDISSESSDNVRIPFHCPVCEQDVEAIEADPLALLFGDGTIVLVCPICESEYEANVTLREDT